MPGPGLGPGRQSWVKGGPLPALEKLQVRCGGKGNSLDPHSQISTCLLPIVWTSPSPFMDCQPATFPCHRGLGQTLSHYEWTALILPNMDQGWAPVQSWIHPPASWLRSPRSRQQNHLAETHLPCYVSRCPERPSSLLFPRGHKSSEGSISSLQQQHIPTCQQLMNCCWGWLMPCEISH